MITGPIQAHGGANVSGMAYLGRLCLLATGRLVAPDKPTTDHCGAGMGGLT